MNSPNAVRLHKRQGAARGAQVALQRPARQGALKALRLATGYLVMIGMAVFSLLPFAWMVSTSLKDMSSVFSIPPRFIPDPILWSNYADVFRTVPLLALTGNTAFISVTATVGQLLTCSMAAYAFARMRWRGRDTVFLLWLGTMMIPGQVTLIPTYVMMSKIGWINSYKPLIIPEVLGGVYGTFLIRQFLMTIPQELEDAAVMDGASPLRIYRTVMIPLSKPVLATYGVFTFMGNWNSFMWPLLMLNSPSKMTLTVGITFMAHSRYTTDWPHLMAGTCMSIIPVLLVLLVANRYFVQGITLTGIKA